MLLLIFAQTHIIKVCMIERELNQGVHARDILTMVYIQERTYPRFALKRELNQGSHARERLFSLS